MEVQTEAKELVKEGGGKVDNGPAFDEVPMPDCIRALNEEFAAIFPQKIPGGCLRLDRRIIGLI